MARNRLVLDIGHRDRAVHYRPVFINIDNYKHRGIYRQNKYIYIYIF
jgi:hypothetical protein